MGFLSFLKRGTAKNQDNDQDLSTSELNEQPVQPAIEPILDPVVSEPAVVDQAPITTSPSEPTTFGQNNAFDSPPETITTTTDDVTSYSEAPTASEASQPEINETTNDKSSFSGDTTTAESSDIVDDASDTANSGAIDDSTSSIDSAISDDADNSSDGDSSDDFGSSDD